MTKKQLAEVNAWKEKNAQIREWLLTHPSRVEVGMWSPSIQLTEVMAAEADREIKNTRLAGRASLRNRLKYLVKSIIPYLKSEQNIQEGTK